MEALPVAIGDNGRLGTVALVIGFVLIAGAAWFAAASLRLRDAADHLLAVYLLSTAAVIVIVLALSPFELVTRTGILAASAVALVAVALLWQARGRPAAPSMRKAAAATAAALREPVLAILAAGVSLCLAYAATLAVATPMNDRDELSYHLPRAALWVQEQGVHYIERAPTTRLNENPPGAELLSAWAMTLEGSDRFAAIFQVIALAATLLAIARIARLLGFSRREAAFGAFLFATLPVVALQAATAGNDLVMTSFVAIVVAFLLSESGIALALGGLALALSVATKGTALFTLPMLLVIAAILVPRRRWMSVAAVGAASIAVGGFWYVFHYFEAEGAAGKEQSAVFERGTRPERIPAYMARLAIDAVDPAGSVGRDRYAYALGAGMLLLLAGVAAWRGRSRAAALAGVVAAGIALLPTWSESLYKTLLRGYQHVLVGRLDDDLVFIGWSRDATVPQPFRSWYGPVGLLAFLLATVLVVRAIRSGSLRKGSLVLVLAPLFTLAIITALWSYSPWHGRFLIPAVALSTATWGVLHRVRAFRWAIPAIALVALLLSFLHYDQKPAGISVLDGRTGRSVWTESRQSILTALAPRSPEADIVRRLDSKARGGETIALRIHEDGVSYPFFDPALERRVVYVDANSGLDADVDWLVVDGRLSVDICPAGWRRELESGGWRLYRRVGLCPGESKPS